jgi:hypothetical protein
LLSAVGAAKNQFIDALYDAIKGMGMIHAEQFKDTIPV